MTARWTLQIDAQGKSGVENMALDEALLDEALHFGSALLRLYCWNPPTLSIGRNQQGVFPDVPIVRRPTGGQAVWHEQEVTYAVAAPIALYGSLRSAYCQIHTRIATALRSLGADTVLAPAPSFRSGQAVRPSGRPAACFAASAGGEILVEGKKLVGSAQVRRGNAFLQHGSILLDGSQAPVSGGTASGETTLRAVLGRAVSFADVTAAIIENWDEE